MEQEGNKIVTGGVGSAAVADSPEVGSSSEAAGAGTVPEVGVDHDPAPDQLSAEEVALWRSLQELHWKTRGRKWTLLMGKRMEERELRETLEGLKTSILPTLAEGNRQIVRKQDEIDQLRKKLLGMKGGSGMGGISCSGGGGGSPYLEGGNGNPTGNGELPGNRKGELIFPEEIWVLIFNHLTDPQDLRNCSISCPLFSRILHPRKTEFLFPLVFPQGCRDLDNSLILSCRQVCKGWNAVIDQVVENHPSLRPFDEGTFNPRDPDMAPPMKANGMEIYRFSNRGGDLRGKNFLVKMRDHRRNPFVGRAVTLKIVANFHEVMVRRNGHVIQELQLINFLPPVEAVGMDPEEQMEQFYDNLVGFLEHFGKDIWYLNFELRTNHAHGRIFGVTTVLQFLTQEIILLCPNLRRLRLEGHVPSKWIDDLDLDSLPAAPHLETLQIDKVRHFMGLGLVLDTMIRKHHKQLKKLHVQWQTLKSLHFNRKEFPLSWENLLELHVDGGDVVEICEVFPEQNIKPIIRMKMPHLQKLVLSPGARRPNWIKKYDFETIMDVIINLSATTKLSVLRIYKGFEAEQVRQAPGTLFASPNLTTLEVEHCDWDSDYTFLLRFPFLESLIVFWPEEGLYEGNGYEIAYKTGPMPQWEEMPRQQKSRLEKRDLLGLGAKLCRAMYEKGMHKYATIWELLPRLKVFIFQRDVYTRREYQRFVEGRKEIKGSE